MNGTFTAVVDRIVDGEIAVLLIEDGDEVVDQFNIDSEELPDEVGEGGVLTVKIDNGEIISMEYLENETESRQQAAQDRFDRLSERLSDS